MPMSPSSHDTLTPQEAAERLARGELDLVDVREVDEWQAAHAPSARHIPLRDLPSQLPALRGTRPVAFVCRSGNRSELATDLARREGIDALNVDGGLLAWHRAGLELTNDDPKRAA